jgi:RNA-binding protein
MSLTSKERAELRAEAHHLRPLVHVGHGGIGAVTRALGDALRTHELVKVQLSKQSEQKPRDAAAELAAAVRADIVQTIGKTVTLYRHNPELERKRGAPPPWRA